MADQRTSRMMLGAVSVLLLAAGGCKDKAVPEASASTPSATAEPACTFHNPDPKFCFAPPPGYASKGPPKQDVGGRSQLMFENKASGGYLIITWSGLAPDFPKCKNVKDNAPPGAVIQDDGQGGCWEDTLKDRGKTKYHYIDVHKKGPKQWISCLSNGPPDAEVPAVLAACRGIRFE